MAVRGSEQYLKVLGYFQLHLCASNKEAAYALKMDVKNLSRYIRLIREDWKNPEPTLLDPVAIEMRLRNLEKVVGGFYGRK